MERGLLFDVKVDSHNRDKLLYSSGSLRGNCNIDFGDEQFNHQIIKYLMLPSEILRNHLKSKETSETLCQQHLSYSDTQIIYGFS
jgi:hypothetical protein